MSDNLYLPNKNTTTNKTNPFSTKFMNLNLKVPLESLSKTAIATRKNKTASAKSAADKSKERLNRCQPIIFTFETTNVSIFQNNQTNTYPNCIFWNQVLCFFLGLFFWKKFTIVFNI